MRSLLYSACFVLLSVPALSFPTLSFPALSSPSIPTTIFKAPARILYQFPPGLHIENIAYRKSRKLLLSVLTKPVLYELDLTADLLCPRLVYDFTNVIASGSGMFGIAETKIEDVFAITGGKWGTENTFSVWTVDFRHGRTPDVRKIASINNTTGLNGLAVIKETNTVLLADSKKGAVWAVNIATGQYNIAVTDNTFLPDDPTKPFSFGINGINIYKGKLYFTNSGKQTFGVIPIYQNGSRSGDATVLAREDSTKNYDDFAMDDEGNSMIATHPDTIYKITPKGDQSSIAVSELIVHPTSSIFGTAQEDKSTLFVSTGGEQPPGVPGGQIIVVENISSMPFTPVVPVAPVAPVAPITFSRWSWQYMFLRQGSVDGQMY